jgi:transcriptional regulator with XRE-family HTH domain
MHDRRTAMRVGRAAKNLTQLQAARAIDMTLLRWNRIETTYLDPTPAEQKAIAKLLGRKRDELFPELMEVGK